MSGGETTFSRGDRVPTAGAYVCVPCGYKHHYKQGDNFGECVSCLAGTEDALEGNTAGTEMWQNAEEDQQ